MNSPSGKNLSFSYAPLSQNHTEGMLLAYSSCACIRINLNLKILRSYCHFFVCLFQLGNRTVPFANCRKHLCVRDDFLIAEYRVEKYSLT